MSAITGCFEAELEARFRDYYDESYGCNVRRAVVVGDVLWLVLGFLHDLNAALLTDDHDMHELTVLTSVRAASFALCIALVAVFRWLPVEGLLRRAPWLSMTGSHCLALLTLVVFSVVEASTSFWRDATMDPSFVLLLILLPSLSATMLRNAHVVTSLYSVGFLLLFLVFTLLAGDYDTPYLITVCLCTLLVLFLYALHSYRENVRTRAEFLQFCHLQQEQELHQRLLQKMLPLSIIGKLRAGAEYVYEKYDRVSVLFSHIHDFDLHTASMQPLQLVRTLNRIFSMFDQLTDEHRVYKVETIGDVFLVSSGCPAEYAREDHASALCVLAVDMMSVVKAIKVMHDEQRRTSIWQLHSNAGSSHSLHSLIPTRSSSEGDRPPTLTSGPSNAASSSSASSTSASSSSSSAISSSRLDLRIGINTGPVIAGVVGVKYPRYRLMGDTINTASRMSTTCDAGEIQLASSTHEELKAADFVCEVRNKVAVKGKGVMQTWILKEHLLPHRVSATKIQQQQQQLQQQQREQTQLEPAVRVDSPSNPPAQSFSYARARASGMGSQTARPASDRWESGTMGEESTNSESPSPLQAERAVSPPYNAQDELEATIRAKSAQVAHLIPSSHRMSVSTVAPSSLYPGDARPADGKDDGPMTERSAMQVRSEPISQLGHDDGGAGADSDPSHRPASAPMSPLLQHVQHDALAPPDLRSASTTETREPSSVGSDLPPHSHSLAPPAIVLPAAASLCNSAVDLRGSFPSSAMDAPSDFTRATSFPRPPGAVPLSSLAYRLAGEPKASISMASSSALTAEQLDPPSHHHSSEPQSHPQLPNPRNSLTPRFPGTPSSFDRGSAMFGMENSPLDTPREPLIHADGTVTLLRAYTSGKLAMPELTIAAHSAALEASQHSEHSRSSQLFDSPISGSQLGTAGRMPRSPAGEQFLLPSALSDAGVQMSPRTQFRFLLPSPSTFDRTVAPSPGAGGHHFPGHFPSLPAPSSRARASTSMARLQPPNATETSPSLGAVTTAAVSPRMGKSATFHTVPVVVGTSSRRRQRDVVITAHSDRVKTAKMFTYGNADALLHLPRPFYARLSQTFYTEPALEEEFQAGKAEREGGTARWWLLLLMAELLPCAVWETIAVLMTGGLQASEWAAVWVLRMTAVAMCCFCYHAVGNDRWRGQRALVVFATCVHVTCMFIIVNVVEGTLLTLYGLCVLLFTFSVTTMFLALPLQLTALYNALSLLCWLVSTLIAYESVDSVILLHTSACLLYLGSSYSSEHRDRLAFIRFLRHANEKTTTANFLANLLPKKIIDSLTLSKQPFIAHERLCADVLFCDVVQFTALAARSSPEDVVAILNVLFSSFDAMTDKYHVYKVETIGDAYLACSGVVEERADHTKLLVECGLAMRRATRLFQTPDHSPIVVRVGIHTGFVIAGVVGRKMPRYHLFGETVSIAEEMEQRAPAGHVIISEATLKAMTPEQWKLFDFAPLEPIRVGADQRKPLPAAAAQQAPNAGSGGTAVRLIQRYVVRTARSAQLMKERQGIALPQSPIITTLPPANYRRRGEHKRAKTLSAAPVTRPPSAASAKKLKLRGSSLVESEFSSVQTSDEKEIIGDDRESRSLEGLLLDSDRDSTRTVE